MVIFGFEQIA